MNDRPPNHIQRPASVWLLIILLIILGLSGVYGGYELMVDTTGERLGFPPDMIDQIPLVDSYYLIAIFLFVVYGAGSLTLAFLLWRARFFSPEGIGRLRSAGVLLGALLVVWIGAQLFLLPGTHFIQFIYLALGFLIALLFTIRPTREYLYGTR